LHAVIFLGCLFCGSSSAVGPGWESGWSNTINPFGLRSFYDYFSEWFSTIENPQPVLILFGFGLLVLSGIFAIKYVREEKRLLPVLGVIVALIVLVIALLVTILIVPCFLGRYLFPLAGTVWIMVAVGIYRMRKTWLQLVLIIGILISGAFVYYQEIKLENENGLEIYKSFVEHEWEEGDVVMADTYFVLMMTIYYPEKEYMIYGGIPRCIPFQNTSSFTEWEQLEDVDTVWYLSLQSFRVGNLDEKYDREEVMVIPFSYYNIVVEKCTVRE